MSMKYRRINHEHEHQGSEHMTTITLTAVKGGQGTTTAAVGLAHAIHAQGKSITVYGPDDLYTVASVDEGPFRLSASSDNEAQVTLMDCGQVVPQSIYPGDLRLLVTRNCYLALKAAVAVPDLRDRFDGVLLIAEPNRALDARDIEPVLGLPVMATVQVNDAIARMVDAGLMSRSAKWFHEAASDVMTAARKELT